MKESEYLEFKKSTSELKEGIISMVSILNKQGIGKILRLEPNTKFKEIVEQFYSVFERKVTPQVTLRKLEEKIILEIQENENILIILNLIETYKAFIFSQDIKLWRELNESVDLKRERVEVQYYLGDSKKDYSKFATEFFEICKIKFIKLNDLEIKDIRGKLKWIN